MKDINWSSLGFGYYPTAVNIRSVYKNGEWGPLELTSETHISIHMAATCLHYGQEAFEGMKAFRGKDGKIRLFRIDENAKRMARSCEGIMMPPIPQQLFIEAVKKVVKANIDYVPPYESGASLYIRPLVIGTGAQVGVRPAEEYMFVIFVSPVGPYFKDGFKPTPMAILRGFDRAAPLGTGTIKVGGNYAAGIKAGCLAHEKGYSAVLFLDAKEKKYLDECGPANFFGIRNGKYITPDSTSILPSITNMSLMQIATDLGLVVEKRHVPVEELAEFEEAGACGTAAVISPILRVDDLDKGISYEIAKNGEAGPISTQLYQTLRAIQYGEKEDIYNWNIILNEE